jgi:protein TonB
VEGIDGSPFYKRSFYESLGLHLFVGLCLGAIVGVSKLPTSTERMEIEVVVQAPKPSPSAAPLPVVNLLQVKKLSPPIESRKIFGVSKKALTLESGGAEAVEVKSGNTISKIQDNEKLKAGDEDALPIPVDEIFVSSMPKLKKEVRATYPSEARALKKEGAVVVELLIDATGKVRETKLIRGIGFGLDEAALTALKQFEFDPARMAEKFVAVRIRYTYRFVLEE